MINNNKKTLFQWFFLFALSFALFFGFHHFRLPAALLLGPMLAAILLSSFDLTVTVSKPLFVLAQSFVGIMIAGQLPVTILSQVSVHWPIFLSGALFTVVAAAVLGWLLSRSGLFSGNTAIWGTSPGAATVMTVMSESFGADIRLVALMQYLRVACCTFSVTLVAKYLGGSGDHPPSPHFDLFTISSGRDFLWTAAIAVLTFVFLQKVNKQSMAFILPMVLGIAFKMLGLTQIVLPGALVAIAYTIIGWSIGLRFTRAILRHAAKLMPVLLLSIAVLIAVNAAFGLVIAKWAGTDYLTAFLATSPGGADSVAIIAASTPVDVGFVVSMQIIRFFMVIILSPVLARWLSNLRRSSVGVVESQGIERDECSD
ncbi:AbrB family transcriptional regulator [Pelobacter seleniigenes]|uniref:AbrB family transcriptional regulator n=1 Tax=Pelobacter seleniigenes TaxID=407188 RepID=UPI000690069C|nr:AbrB family transcriptional regulator [Pelobacter seleniigenes]